MEDTSDSFANRMRHDLRFGLLRRFRKWLTLGLSAEVGYVLQVGNDDLVLMTSGGTPVGLDFLRHRVFGRLAVHY